MAGRLVRAAVVGASTLLGKEVAEQLKSALALGWDLTLLDAGQTGQVTSAGDEAMVIQALEPGSFAGMDVVFFAGDAATTAKHWKQAAAAGAAVVDCSGALHAAPGVLVRSPWIDFAGASGPDLTTTAVVAAHPAALMLGLAARRLRARWKDARLMATLLEPASQQGSAGLDEMHQQTVGLLSFKALPKDLYDAQVAFNISAALGSAAKLDLDGVATSVRRDLALIAGEHDARAVAMQLLQAPVFHGYTASVFVVVTEKVPLTDVTGALDGGVVRVVGEDEDDQPSNLSATEQEQVLVREDTEAQGFWLWMAADNLRLTAQNAVACGAELVSLRPLGKVQ